MIFENTKKKATSRAVQRVLSHFGQITAPAKDGIPFLGIKNFVSISNLILKILHFLAYF